MYSSIHKDVTLCVWVREEKFAKFLDCFIMAFDAEGMDVLLCIREEDMFLGSGEWHREHVI